MSEHTPGPWETHLVGDESNSVRVCKADDSERGCYSVAEAEVLGIARETAEANARLIAAAPELLAACALAHRMLTGASSEHPHVLTVALRAAIAKAEGRS